MNFTSIKQPFKTSSFVYRNLVLTALFLFFSLGATAQKKPLDHSVYDAWQNIGVKLWSNDGKSALYQVVPQEGDKTLYLKDVNSDKELQLARGENPVFTSDSKYAIVAIKPFFKDIREGKIKKKKDEELPKDSLAIITLSNYKVTKIPLLKSFKVPEKGGSKVAYLLEKEIAVKSKDSVSTDSVKKPKEAVATPSKKKEDKSEPLQLVLLDIMNGKQITIENVVEYEFSKNGKHLIFATQEKVLKDSKKVVDSTVKKETYGVFQIDTENFVKTTLLEGNGEFNQFVFDESGQNVVFIGTTDEKKKEIKTYRLYHSYKNAKAVVLADEKTKGIPLKWTVSENKKPIFSRNSKKLFFGIAPEKIAKDTTLIVDDHAIVDIWNYKDDYLQTVQLKNLEKELKRSYLTVINLDQPKVAVPLATLKLQEVELVDEGNADYVLGFSDVNGRIETQWNGFAPRDYFMINTRTGKVELVVEALNGRAFASPLGKYIVYYDRVNGSYYSYNVASKKRLQLNNGIKVSFVDEEFDMPDLPNFYGIAAWTEKDESILIKDRYDIWEFFLNDSKSVSNITKNYGRANQIRFDLKQFDPELRSISRKSDLVVTAFNEKTKEAGYFKIAIVSIKQPQLLLMESIGNNNSIIKAKDTDQYMYVRESFTQPPSLYFTSNFKEQTLLMSTNPQQSNYNWGSASLVSWTTTTGKPATGVLYKPEDFDSTKKYPMIVYFYEKLSDNLNRYEAPAPTPSRLNISYFVSNGYLVFTPDISYEKGYPGRAAEEYINSGVNYLKQNTWVASDKIGIQGQSWGGYQVAHLITRTNMYAAAWTGAPVVNMTSAYGGIRWSTGMNRQFQYEKTQSRIGATLWEAQDLYIENSPLFFMDRVQTPVAIMHNDNDGAVPWYQGIEMFTALRRLGKPVWMLNYNGDEHNLMKRQNRKDIQIREQQFFDHYLKGAPMPVWMDSGVPAVLKGKTWGLELVN